MSKNAIKIHIDLNEPAIAQKLTSDKFGRLVSSEWKRLLDPYTPEDTGVLMGITGQTVDLMPFKIHYKSTYANYVYFSNGWNFKKPFSTDHWDEKAAQAGQLDKLYRTLNKKLQNGQY